MNSLQNTTEIITIGDELLFGQIADTNSKWMSDRLDVVGLRTVRKTTVGDNRDDILQAFRQAEDRADVILITGGLGPTNDDLTKPCLAEYFGCEITMNEQALVEVTEFFSSRGRPLSETNRLQAALPVCCEMISNPLGTAPGMWFEKSNKIFVSMPGVPHEMEKMMTDTIIPRLLKKIQPSVIYHKIVRTVGIGESWLADKIKPWEDQLPENIRLAYLPEIGQVKLRLTATGTNGEAIKAEVGSQVSTLRGLAGEFVYGFDEELLEEILGKMLLEQRKTISLAESCTGGYVSHKITSIAGSSAYYLGSVIPYHNALKKEILGVNENTLLKYGAVSEETVHEMANLVRKKFNADIGVATSGIAGPEGGTPEKPVGTVWIAYADGAQTITKKLQLSKDREVNIKATTVAVLDLVRRSLAKSI